MPTEFSKENERLHITTPHQVIPYAIVFQELIRVFAAAAPIVMNMLLTAIPVISLRECDFHLSVSQVVPLTIHVFLPKTYIIPITF